MHEPEPAEHKIVRPGDANRRIKERRKLKQQWALARRIYGGLGLVMTLFLLVNVQALGLLTGVFVVMILGACSLALLVPDVWAAMLKSSR